MIIQETDYLAHYGILRRSGRYPWGSGGNVAQRSRSFLDLVRELRGKGLTERQIAEGFSMTTTELRAANSIARNSAKQADIGMAQRLKDKGMSNIAIGQRMGINESSVRALLTPGARDKADNLAATSNMLKTEVDNRGFIDVGIGVERHLGVSRSKLDVAIARLKEEGYQLHSVQIDQLGTNTKTTIKVLAPPGTTYRDIASNRDKIASIANYSDDGGRSYTVLQPPLSLSSKRVGIRYAEDGGADSDGVIFVRPGVEDVSLGGSRYAQVRIAVDGTHYIKGMAMYKEGLPNGVDVVFNTNKSSTGNKLDALKPLKTDKETGQIDSDLPFGSVLRRQITKTNSDGSKTVSSAMNIVNEEGNWETWSRSLSSQVLSKQRPSLAQRQLSQVQINKQKELDEITNLTNPAVRRKLLKEFADSADAASVHLKAANLDRQANYVILPVNTMKETEVYAPAYRNGEKVVLIRHPHGGIFEIPELTVNNRHPEAKKLLGSDAPDAIGINHKVAQRLSGADFDGDTVLVIPNDKRHIKTAPALEGLKNFDPLASFPGHPGMKVMSARTKGFEMGDISNLITDMTIQGAPHTELARAVRHSMVVIDAEKHGLDWKASAEANGISQLKIKYQGKADAGASTLISRAGSRKDVLARRPRSASKGGAIDPATGKKIFEPTGESWKNTKGNIVFRTERSKKLAEVDDARSLVSANGGTKIEAIYAEHSNQMKALANKARRELLATKSTPYSPSAKAAYAKQVASLDAKLNVALRNAPLERHAQVIGFAIVSQKRQANPDMEPEDFVKIKAKALNDARARTGAGKIRIEISDSEWQAIQAGAISNEKLTKILDNSDTERVKALATPKSKLLMTDSKTARAQAMLARGLTQAEVADALGVSLTTLKDSLK
jgi:DNA-binding CsgD family transcriptional regulator